MLRLQGVNRQSGLLAAGLLAVFALSSASGAKAYHWVMRLGNFVPVLLRGCLPA